MARYRLQVRFSCDDVSGEEGTGGHPQPDSTSLPATIIHDAAALWNRVVQNRLPERLAPPPAPDARPSKGKSVAGEFMSAWETAECARVRSDRAQHVAAPARFQPALKRHAAGFQPLRHRKPDGDVSAMAPRIDMQRIIAETSTPGLVPARVLVLCCGGGGASLAFRGFEHAVVTAAVDYSQPALKIYAANCLYAPGFVLRLMHLT